MGAELPRLVPFARVVYHNRNRAYTPSHGRFMQRDPNRTAMNVLADGVAQGRSPDARVQAFDLMQLYGDGANLFQYLGSSTWTNSDPMGLMIGAAISFGLPGPGDMISSALSSLVSEYSANLDWDVQWATDWETGDDWHSRLDDRWITLALMRGLYDSFFIGVPGTDVGLNPLDVFANAGGSRFGQRIIRVGGRVGRFSERLHVNVASGSYYVNKFVHPKYRRAFVIFPDSAIKRTVRIKPRGGPEADKAAANKRFGKPAKYNWEEELGVPHTWHHDNVRGRMYLVPSDLHQAVGHVGGAKVWYE